MARVPTSLHVMGYLAGPFLITNGVCLTPSTAAKGAIRPYGPLTYSVHIPDKERNQSEIGGNTRKSVDIRYLPIDQ